MSEYKIAVTAIAFAFGIARIFSGTLPEGLAADSFKDFAHIFVGGLFGAWLVDRSDRHWLWLAVGLSVWEVICAVAQRLL